MASLFFALGSTVGAALAWFVGHRQSSRSTVVAVNGIASALLGVLTSASTGMTPSAVEAGFGLLGTVAPLTLCMTPSRVVGAAGIASAVRHLAATLALALVCGISCATLGFVTEESVRHFSDQENLGKPVGYPIVMPLRPSFTVSAAFPRRL